MQANKQDLKLFKFRPKIGWNGWEQVAEREVRRRAGKSPSEKRICVSPSPNQPT